MQIIHFCHDIDRSCRLYLKLHVLTCCLLQMVMPKFPVIVKIGHAYAGMGKVRVTLVVRSTLR